MTWFDEHFSMCGHGLVRGYCHVCQAAADDAFARERKERERARVAEDRSRGLEARAARQSAELSRAYRYIARVREERLREQQARERRSR